MRDFTCAECGTTTAQTYVVTTLDPNEPQATRTEVCLDCHKALTPDLRAAVARHREQTLNTRRTYAEINHELWAILGGAE